MSHKRKEKEGKGGATSPSTEEGKKAENSKIISVIKKVLVEGLGSGERRRAKPDLSKKSKKA